MPGSGQAQIRSVLCYARPGILAQVVAHGHLLPPLYTRLSFIVYTGPPAVDERALVRPVHAHSFLARWACFSVGSFFATAPVSPFRAGRLFAVSSHARCGRTQVSLRCTRAGCFVRCWSQEYRTLPVMEYFVFCIVVYLMPCAMH